MSYKLIPSFCFLAIEVRICVGTSLFTDVEYMMDSQDAPPAEVDYLLDAPDFYVCEGQVVAVGRVPGQDE